MRVLSLTPAEQQVAQDRLVGLTGAWKLPPTLPSLALLQVPTGNPRYASCGPAFLGPPQCAVQLPRGQGLQVSSSVSRAVCKPVYRGH